MKGLCEFCIERSRCENGFLECTESLKRKAMLERRRKNLKGWLKKEIGDTETNSAPPKSHHSKQ